MCGSSSNVMWTSHTQYCLHILCQVCEYERIVSGANSLAIFISDSKHPVSSVHLNNTHHITDHLLVAFGRGNHCSVAEVSIIFWLFYIDLFMWLSSGTLVYIWAGNNPRMNARASIYSSWIYIACKFHVPIYCKQVYRGSQLNFMVNGQKHIVRARESDSSGNRCGSHCARSPGSKWFNFK